MKYLIILAAAVAAAIILFTTLGYQLQQQTLELAESGSTSGDGMVTIAGPIFCEGKTQAVQTLLDASGFCNADQDCALIRPGCPFGCLKAVRRDAAERITASVAEHSLVGCASCQYRCGYYENPIARCVGDRCEVMSLSRPPLIEPDLGAGFFH